MSGSGTEYRRTVTFACPHCFGVVTREVWIGDLGEVRRMMTRCPVCGLAMLRVDSENEECLVSLLKITCRKIFDAIARQEEEHYARR